MRHNHHDDEQGDHVPIPAAEGSCRETSGFPERAGVRARYGSVVFASNRHRRRRRGLSSVVEHEHEHTLDEQADSKQGIIMSAADDQPEVKPAPPKERRFKLSRYDADSCIC